MPDRERLIAALDRLDGRPYPAYRDLQGAWRLGDLTLLVDHVQGDPFAAPSRVRLRAPSGLGRETTLDPDRRCAAEDWLLRAFGRALQGERRGSGRSGELSVYQPGPEVVERSAVRLHGDGTIEVRFSAGLPAHGRRILGPEARGLLLEDIPRAARSLEPAGNFQAHLDSVVHQRDLRRALEGAGLVAFVADGSALPRKSGVDQRPLPGAVPLVAPDSLRVTLDTSHGAVSGLGIPRGVTLITGGGFHGKSTLLQAVQRGHLDHVPGDGRERVVTVPDAVKVRAEDGRRVERVDISAFLADLPMGRGTRPFSTDDASGSTSQAAAMIEAIESGATVLLLDEDTSATNLLVRDERMRQLVPRDREPITPFVERVRELYSAWGVSTILVVGGVGDFLAVADLVVGMDRYRPLDLTGRARQLAGPVPESPAPLERPLARRPRRRGLELGDRDKVRARDERRLGYGHSDVELLAVEQVLDGAHATTLGQALRVLAQSEVDGERTLAELLDRLDALLLAEGVDALSPFRHPPGHLVRPRRHEVAAALNRLRSLEVG